VTDSLQQFNPEALIVARDSRGETQTSVAAAIGVQQGFVSKVENGVHGLSAEQVDAVGHFLNYPPEFFYESGPILQGKSGCMYHSKRKTVPAKIVNQIYGVMAARLINTRHLLHGLELVGQRSFHVMDPDEYGSPEAVARALRTAWRMPDGPVRDLVTLIESAGGIVLMRSFGTQKFFGMSQWTTVDQPLFFLNSDVPMDVLRWTIAHELGHLVMHSMPTSEDLEVQADAFAGEFLAPRRLILPDLKNLTFSRLPALKMHWRLSMKALIKRAETLGAIDRRSAVKLYKQYSARRWNFAEPHALPIEQPTLIYSAAKVHLGDHGYTIGELAKAIRLSKEELLSEFLQQQVLHQGLSLVR
jgi:Zn-dependent peptidase ImmA (M78 family)/transcriptional regulator with XRE-family HTH domain